MQMKKSLISILLLLFIQTSFSQQNDNKINTQSLLMMSGISVTIGGDFIVTGSFPALTTERVDQFVTSIYNEGKVKALGAITDPQLLEKINKKLDEYSLRNIILKRANGEVVHIDLLKFRTTGDFKYNPYLKNDDVLIFAPVDWEHDFFTISGAVNKPGKFPFVDGDKLSDAIMLAQGINKAYENVTKAEISRLSYDGNTLISDTVDVSSDYTLKRGDRIIILAKETQRKDFSVLVIGEVNSPGNIPITKNSTTLKEVVEKAGGLKSSASLTRARLFSGNTIPLLLEKEYGITLKDKPDIINLQLNDFLVEQEKILMARLSNMTEEDTAYFFMENQLRVLEKGSGIDFSKLNDKNSEASKYIVKNGDIILIPKKQYAVYVFGQVVHPGFIPYEKGENYEYYIQKADGVSPYATKDIMVIKSGSREWLSVTDPKLKIEDGDYIFVPKEPQRSFNYTISRIGFYLGIVSSVATVVLLLVSLRKL